MTATIFDRDTKVTVWFGLNVVNDEAFTLDDPTLGVLDGTGLLVGDVGTDIASSVYDIQITRGRSRELDTIQAGVCTLRVRNFDRLFDPLNAELLLDGEGTPILTENGEYILVDGSVIGFGLTPGKRVTVELYGQVVYDGSVEDLNVTYEPRYRSDASIAAVDALGTLGRRKLHAWSVPAALSGQRVHDVLSRPEVGFPMTRAVDPGVSSLAAGDVTWKTNALTYLQKVAESEFGMLFAARDNTLTFLDRATRRTMLDPVLTFSTEGDGLPIHGLELAVGSELLYTSVDIDREGGTLQTVEDAAAQAEYGIRPLTLSGLLMDTDTEALSMAEWLLLIYKEPTQRVASVRVNLSALPSLADRGAVAALDLGSIVTVRAQPLNTGVVFEQTSLVEGIDHAVAHGTAHYMTLRLSPLEAWGAGFTLDDDELGELDSSAAVLAF